MKKRLVSAGALLGIALVAMVSCKKGELENPEDEEHVDYVYRLDKIDLVVNPHDVRIYAENSEDKDDEKISNHLINMAVHFREAVKHENINKEILEGALLSSISVFDVDKLSFLQSNERARINNEKAQLLLKELQIADLTHKATNQECVQKIEQYKAVIYVPNAKNADASLSPIISMSVEVEPDMEGLENYENALVGWYYDEKGILNEIILTEEMANVTNNPIFILDNGSIEPVRTNLLYNNGNETQKSLENARISSVDVDANSSIHTYEFKINERFETTLSGKSEFAIAAYLIDENGQIHQILKNNLGNFTPSITMFDVSKSDVGKDLARWYPFWNKNDVDAIPANQNYLFWNTFEYDWGTSEKPLGEGTANGKTVYAGGNRKYSGDWYRFDPYTSWSLNGNNLSIATVFSSWALWSENSRSKLRFWKVVPN